MSKDNALKKYSALPVVVVEDHNEALPHIYRSIGRRYLPLSGVTLIHFDSHPDMLIPVSMPADLVYNKHQLFESLSIENWILPAVYAGHISHVIWIKPPWCGQVADQSSEFYVGKCKKTGTIRTTCSESYFLSETLYVPEDQLENKQKLKFTCITLCPKDWHNFSSTKPNKPEPSTPNTCRPPENTGSGEVTQNSYLLTGEITQNSNLLTGEVTQNSNLLTGEATAGNLNENNQCDNSVTDTGVGEKRSASPSHNNGDVAMTKKQRSGDCVNSNENCQSKTDEETSQHMKKCEHFASPSADVIHTLEKDLENVHCVLDIDLDFFSTMNPFKEMYGERQYKILQELYQFHRPSSSTEQDLADCVNKRDKQLSELKNALKKLEQDSKADLQHDRADLIHTLVSDLREGSPGKQLDFDLLHEAGCTCDDTELPHHISSSTQITSLVDAVQELLSFFKKPTFITIARSSSDDYCPPNQVDHIQTSVLDLLQDLYLEIALTTDYEHENST